MKTYKKIQQGKKKWEKSILVSIKHYNKKGEGYLTGFGLNPMPYWNALDRLEKSGKIKFSKAGKKHKGDWIAN